MAEGSQVDKVLLFVHGLSGSSDGTWGQMIELFRRDRAFSDFALDSYEYPTSKIRFAFGRKMPRIQDLAEGLASYIRAYHAEKKEIVLVGHSLGGLVLRYYILGEIKRGPEIAITAAVMIATPHTGSSLGNLGKSFSWDHAHLKQLSKGEDVLRSILEDWGTLKVEERIRTLYVTGGIDAVVDRDSSMPYFGVSNFENLIGYGHVNVIKPDHPGDIRFLVVKKFVENSLPKPGIISSERIIYSSPLFYRYEIACEPYYLLRSSDDKVAQALESSNVWLSGPSGTGKTVALTRAILLRKWNLFYFTLDGFSERPAEALLKEICRLFLDRVGVSDDCLSGDINLPEILRCFARAISSQSFSGKIVIFIEEIPITSDGEYSKFLELAYHLSMLHDQGLASCNVVWVFTSIVNPGCYIQEKKDKIQERFEFLRFSAWRDAEMRALLDKLAKELGVVFSEAESSQIVLESKGSPRILKTFLKAIRTEVGRTKEIGEILSTLNADARQ
ncbi:esterase/lipase family protein [Pseudomonas quasicaspiana]|uniref:esterase/lipase family protein n=1 Tax=Pseudomonas quasicaspiana TaxID=2829821 RepID=UPI001E575D96|nr:alpha/beta hydrolase [Pseudomonas quasicaspiana]MCD5980664.1 alpha/beta hydrolase [Pseudomonas quasicaspiana]